MRAGLILSRGRLEGRPQRTRNLSWESQDARGEKAEGVVGGEANWLRGLAHCGAWLPDLGGVQTPPQVSQESSLPSDLHKETFV